MFNVQCSLAAQLNQVTQKKKKKKKKKKKLYHSDCGFGGKAAVANRYIQIRIFFFFFNLYPVFENKSKFVPIGFFFFLFFF